MHGCGRAAIAVSTPIAARRRRGPRIHHDRRLPRRRRTAPNLGIGGRERTEYESNESKVKNGSHDESS
jgi:hypothetical protein